MCLAFGSERCYDRDTDNKPIDLKEVITMKKTAICAIALFVCTLTAIGCLAGCGSAGNSAKTETTAAVTTAATAATESAATAVAADSEIIGSWDSEEAPGTVYTFNQDGTGQLDASGSILSFTFTEQNGRVAISYGGSKTPEIYECDIFGGKLIMNATDGTSYTYIKK